MKIKQTNEAGEEIEVEVLSAEEKLALEQSHQTVVTEKDTAINTLANDKKILEDKIAKLELDGIKEDHPNFKVLKEALGKKDEEIKNIRTEIDADKKKLKQEAMDSKVKLATKGNPEFESKVKLHLEKTLASMPEDTEEQRQAKLEAAVKLSADSNEAPGMFDMGTGGGGFGGGGEYNQNTVEFTAREKSLGKKLGITDADYKKYGPRLTVKNK